MKTETYEALRAKCYEIIYDGEVPLEFGVQISHKEFGVWTITNDKKKDEYWLTQVIYDDLGNSYRNAFPKYLRGLKLIDQESDFEYLEDCKILGKPLEYGDLFRVLPSLANFSAGESTITCPVGKMKQVPGLPEGYCKPSGMVEIKLDLTKPIREQDEEVGQKLLQLIS